MIFRQLFDAESSTYTYVLGDEHSREAVIIDPVIEHVERDLTLLAELNLKLTYALDTHVHADHVTALGTLRDRTGCKTVLSEKAGVGCADRFVQDQERIEFGDYALIVRETPGHTSGCLTFVLSDASMAFTGDVLLIRGSGRTDFQQGDARVLYQSVHEKIFSLPDGCLLYPGHDYKGRTCSSVGEEKAHNPRLGGNRDVEAFVDIMSKLQLAYPKKIDVALPANLQCGVPRDVTATPDAPSKAPWAPIEMSAGGVPEVPVAWVASHPQAGRLIDVRETPELTSELGHIPNIEHVPLAEVEARAKDWDRSDALVVICRSGGRSGKAALTLKTMGFAKVVSMRGGMLAWNEWRYPTSNTVVSS